MRQMMHIYALQIKNEWIDQWHTHWNDEVTNRIQRSPAITDRTGCCQNHSPRCTQRPRPRHWRHLHFNALYNNNRIWRVCTRWHGHGYHCSVVIMAKLVSQMTSLTIVYSTVYSGADHGKHHTGDHWYSLMWNGLFIVKISDLFASKMYFGYIW